jgi:NAD-dependent dihydropyrimidine dehydrogenase PreA subunit
MKRKIVKIDDEKCTGCGECIPNCHEGALQIIDGKVRLISDLLCDGLGACLGHCPEEAITIEEREAEPYNEKNVMQEMISKGKNTVIAHMKHLKEHGEHGFLKEAVAFLMENKTLLSFTPEEVISQVHNHGHAHHGGGGCPGSQTISFASKANENNNQPSDQKSELRQWPVQMYLVNPVAPYYRNSDLLLAADCVAFAMGDFHSQHLKGKSLAIACPKLDSNQDVYLEKLVGMIDEAKVNTITVMMMTVPCCGGLLRLVQMAQQKAIRKVPVKVLIVDMLGEIVNEEWV